MADHRAFQHRVAVGSGGLPLPALLFSELSGDYRNLVGYHKCGIKTDTELTDDIHFGFLIVQRLFEI